MLKKWKVWLQIVGDGRKLWEFFFEDLVFFTIWFPRMLVFLWDHSEFDSFRKKHTRCNNLVHTQFMKMKSPLIVMATDISLFCFYQKILINLWNKIILKWLVHVYIMFALSIPWELKVWETVSFTHSNLRKSVWSEGEVVFASEMSLGA